MKQICLDCRWFYEGKDKSPNACYYNGKWSKWLKKGSEDKPNNCEGYEK